MWHALFQLFAASCGICSVVGDLVAVAIGDWGGDSDETPSTLGQRMTAMGLSRVAHEQNAELALMLGDNFYEHGISGSVTSSRFYSTFEAVYENALPYGRPYYAMAGNHDYGKGVPANISAQLAYSRQSSLWNFPALWYKVQKYFVSGSQTRSIDILVIDTVVLCGGVGDVHGNVVDQELEFLGEPANRATPGALRQRHAARQWAWLKQELVASSADYLWVAGHYPMWSAGGDGPQQCLVEQLHPLLAMHGAHYISGHDHNLEHFVWRGVHMSVVGAGKMCCYRPEHLGDVPEGALKYLLAGPGGEQSQPQVPFPVWGGFASLRFGSEAAVVSFHAHNGSLLYSSDPIPRRRLDFALRRPPGTVGAAKADPARKLNVLILLWTVSFAAILTFRRRETGINPECTIQQPTLLG